jgi:hypothetical protein
MAADYAALESRVAELERQLRHILPGKIDAVAYGVSLMHEDTQAIRGILDVHGQQLAGLADRLDSHGQLLEAILRRLPPEPE